MNTQPLILVFYLYPEVFQDKEILKQYSTSLKTYFDEQNDDVRLIFLPTQKEERVECVNPVNIDKKDELNKLDKLISEVKEKFDI